MPTVTWARVDPARRAVVVEAAEAEFGAHGFFGDLVDDDAAASESVETLAGGNDQEGVISSS